MEAPVNHGVSLPKTKRRSSTYCTSDIDVLLRFSPACSSSATVDVAVKTSRDKSMADVSRQRGDQDGNEEEEEEAGVVVMHLYQQ